VTAMGDEANDALGRQLIRHAEAISQLRRDLDQLASEVTDAVADLVTRLELESTEDSTINSSREQAGVTAWCWRDLGLEASESLWHELSDWVAWIRHRYPLAKRVPACWPEHPEIVEELTALWLAWNSAYSERDAPLTGAIDWHDRWLPGLLHRLEHGVFALNCGHDHHERPSSAYALPFIQPPLPAPRGPGDASVQPNVDYDRVPRSGES
jgi:hypothetical protein